MLVIGEVSKLCLLLSTSARSQFFPAPGVCRVARRDCLRFSANRGSCCFGLVSSVPNTPTQSYTTLCTSIAKVLDKDKHLQYRSKEAQPTKAELHTAFGG